MLPLPLMKVFHGIENFSGVNNPILTIGTFDGVHIGHQHIIRQMNEEAEKIGGESTLLTFHPHPRWVVNPEETGLKLIQTLEEKLDKLAEVGMKNVIIQPFDKAFSITDLVIPEKEISNCLKNSRCKIIFASWKSPQ